MATQVEKVSLPQIQNSCRGTANRVVICRRMIVCPAQAVSGRRRVAGSRKPSAAQLVIKHDDSAQVPTRIEVGITAIYFIKPIGSRD